MTRDPERDVFYAEALRDELGRGVRVYTTSDDIYEARQTRRHQSRIYGNQEDGWYAKVRIPEHRDRVARETMNDIASNVAPLYHLDPQENELMFEDEDAFTEDLETSDRVWTETEDIKLAYNQDDQVDIEETKLTEATAFGVAGGYVAAGAGAAALVVGGPIGPVAAPIAGGAAGYVAWVAETWVADAFDTNKTPTFLAASMVDRNRKEKYRGDVPDHAGFYEELNGQESSGVLGRLKNGATKVLPLTPQADETAEHHREVWDQVVHRQFEKVDRLQGVTAKTRTESYEEAVEFVGTALGKEAEPFEAPSLYTNTDAFQAMFSTLEGTDRERLVANVFERDDVATGVTGWLDDEHEELVKQVGQERSMGV